MIFIRYKGSYLSFALVLFSFYFAMGIFGSILSVYLGGIGKSTEEISFIVSGSNIFAFVIVPFVSYIHDRVTKSYRVTWSVLFLAAMFGMLFSFTKNTMILFALNGLSMSFIQCVSPICERLCSSGKYRYGNVRVWGAVGYATAAQIAGIIYQNTTPQLLFFLFALALTVTFFGYWGAKGTESSMVSTKKTEKTKDSLFWWNKNFILFLAASFIFAGSTGLNSTYLPMLLVERGQIVAQVGTILFLATLMEVPIILLSAKFMDSFNEKTLLTAAFGIIAIQFLLYGLSETYLIVNISCVLLKSVATMLYIMITIKVVVNVVDEKFTVSALGLTATVKSLGSVVFQNLGGSFIGLYSISALYLALAAFAVLGFILSLLIKVKENKVIFQ